MFEYSETPFDFDKEYTDEKYTDNKYFHVKDLKSLSVLEDEISDSIPNNPSSYEERKANKKGLLLLEEIDARKESLREYLNNKAMKEHKDMILPIVDHVQNLLRNLYFTDLVWVAAIPAHEDWDIENDPFEFRLKICLGAKKGFAHDETYPTIIGEQYPYILRFHYPRETVSFTIQTIDDWDKYSHTMCERLPRDILHHITQKLKLLSSC